MASLIYKKTYIFLPLIFSPCLAATHAVLAQSAPPTATAAVTAAAQQIDTITVSAKAAPVLDVDRADVGGFGQTIAKTPQSITVLTADVLSANAIQTLSQAIKLDASLADSYNTTGYIESVSVRGFLLNQSGNYRRDGLAISNLAPVAIEGIEQIEVLKGVAGLQAGVSAPGGLLQTISKKPLRESFVTLNIHADQNGSAKLHVDANTVFANNIGIRFNVATEKLRSQFDATTGERQFASIAIAIPFSAATSVSIGADYHRRSQPDVPGLGLLDSNGDGVADTLPTPTLRLAKLNLNNQPWSLPFQSTSTTLQVVFEHRFNQSWSARLAANAQRIKINDRIAFPDGCGSAANYVYPGLCANGDVDVYDFRSEGEQHPLSSWDVRLDGRVNLASMAHNIRAGFSGRHSKDSLPDFQTYNYAGTTNIFAPVALLAAPSPFDRNTSTHERTTEAYASLNTAITSEWQSFAGVRVSRFHRDSARSDGARAVSLNQNVTTPWAGLSFASTINSTVYVSIGQGAELESVPNRPAQYLNAGAVLPALKSKQIEIGAKWQVNPRMLLSAAAFNIEKPYAEDRVVATGVQRVADTKTARHRGLELNAAGRVNEALSIQASATWLDATFTRAEDVTLVGKRVTNVPRLAASLFADYKIAALPGLAFNALATLQDGKTVTADGQVKLPTGGQIDLGARYLQRLTGLSQQGLLWRLNIENATNRIYWREAPTQSWGGIYIFPSTPRTVRASMSVDF